MQIMMMGYYGANYDDDDDDIDHRDYDDDG